MVNWTEFLNTTYYGNTGQAYAIAFGIFLGLFIVLKIFDSSIIVWLKAQAKKSKNEYDDIAADFVDAIHWQFYAYLSFYIATKFIVLSERADQIIGVLLWFFIAFYAAQGLSRIVDFFTQKQVQKRKKDDNPQNTSMIRVFGTIFKAIIWILALLMILSNLGIEITPLVASLGVGGIAIAIALQAVLADLFAAFAIYFDKPFVEGDFIIIGDDMGTIKRIGIKTTRIQTLSGQELVVSNTDLTSTRINNYKQMERRRVVLAIGVEYGTPVKKLKKANELIKKAIVGTKGVTFDRVHFNKFGDFSLNFEAVYYVEDPDYAKFMDVQQEVGFKIAESFEKEKIEFAFPTQTIHVKK